MNASRMDLNHVPLSDERSVDRQFGQCSLISEAVVFLEARNGFRAFGFRKFGDPAVEEVAIDLEFRTP